MDNNARIYAEAEQMRLNLQRDIRNVENVQVKMYLDSADNRLYAAMFAYRKAPEESKAHYAWRIQHAIDMARFSSSRERLTQLVQGKVSF